CTVTTLPAAPLQVQKVAATGTSGRGQLATKQQQEFSLVVPDELAHPWRQLTGGLGLEGVTHGRHHDSASVQLVQQLSWVHLKDLDVFFARTTTLCVPPVPLRPLSGAALWVCVPRTILLRPLPGALRPSRGRWGTGGTQVFLLLLRVLRLGRCLLDPYP